MNYKSVLVVLALLNLTACASKPHGVSALGAPQSASTTKSPKIELDKIEKTITHLNAQIAELHKLDGYRLRQKVDEYGSVDSMQANIKILEELKTEAKN